MGNDTAQYEYEYFSLKLNGSEGVRCSLPSTCAGAGAFTVMGWFYIADASTEKHFVVQNDNFAFGVENELLYFSYGSDKTRAEKTVHVNMWNHVAFEVFDSYVQMFLNGEAVATLKCDGLTLNSIDLILGGNYSGYLRNIVLYQDALVSDDIEACMYNDPIDGYVLWCDFTCNPPVERKSGSSIILNNESIIKVMPVAELNGYSYFKCEELNVGSWIGPNYPFSVQTWLWLDPNESQDTSVILSNYNLRSNDAFEIGFIHREDGYHIYVCFGDVTNILFEISNIVSTQVWHNVAVTYNGSSLKIFLDGECEDELTDLSLNSMQLGSLLIGARSTNADENGSYWYRGYMTRMDIWTRELTREEVKNYVQEIPQTDSEDLAASWEFYQDAVVNYVTGAYLVKVNSVGVVYVEKNTDDNTREVVHQNKQDNDIPVIPEALLKKARLESGIDEPMEQEEAISHPCMINSCEYEDKIYFIYHDKENSYPITCIDKDDADEVVVWCVELILIILETIASYFLSQKITYSSTLAQYIRANILGMPAVQNVVAIIACGGTVTAAMTAELVSAILRSGKLKKLIGMMCSISFWGIISFIAGFARRLVSAGVELAIWIGILVARIAIHIAKYPKERNVSLTLKSVLFCHKETDSVSSMPMRKDYRNKYELPEWQNNGANNAPVLYSLASFSDKKLKIIANILCTNTTKEKIIYKVVADGGDVFGTSEENTITCPPGLSTISLYFIFPNAEDNLNKYGINKLECNISWKYKEFSNDANNDYIVLQSTTHDIYVVLDTVKSPWGIIEQTHVIFGRGQVKDSFPMADIYEATIDIVRGLQTKAAVMNAFTQYIYYCGRYKYYSEATVSRSACLNEALYRDYILENPASGHYNVNCADCCCILASLANMYGCDMTFIDLEHDFKVNEILFIGETVKRYPNTSDQSFHYHFLNKEGIYNVNDPTDFGCYDACFKYKGNKTRTDKLAIGEIFSGDFEGIDTYRESICEDATAVAQCNIAASGYVYFQA